jgi:hypothetical protein
MCVYVCVWTYLHSKRGSHLTKHIHTHTPKQKQKQGTVTLGPYKNGVLSLSLPTPQVDEKEVASTVAAAEKKRFKLTPVRFVEEGGTRMGHTIMCDWKASYVKVCMYV